MPNDIPLPPQSSIATTAATEPEVIAGISSADGNPDLPLSFNADQSGTLSGRWLFMLVAGVAAGYGAAMWLRRGSGSQKS